MTPTAAPELSDHDLRTVQALAYRLAGIRIADGKRMLVQHRLSRRVRERGLASYREYCALLARPEEAAEVQRCVNALTTNETFFFRHKQHWDFIAERVVPAWRESRRTPRAWCAACSTGEEPYSLAIVLHELLTQREAVVEASDINDIVLRAAEAGVYGEYALQKVTPLCLARHFRPLDGERHAVVPALRSAVRFRQANLLLPSTGAPYDLVLLRNVLIYFDEASKTRALTLVAERMNEGAFLLIGGAESLGARASCFTYVSPGIYRKSTHAPEITFDAAMMAEFSDEFSGKLAELNHLLIAAERDGDGAACITDLFRAAHSLKGLAALAGLQGASAITHHLESVLERVRSGAMPFSPRIVDAGFSACDHLQRLLDDFLGEASEESDIAGCLALLQETAAGQPAPSADGAALVKAAPESDAKPAAERSDHAARDLEMLRVDPARLDVVLNLSSELMIARARLGDQYRTLGTIAARVDLAATPERGAGAGGCDALREAVAAIEGMEQTVLTVHRLASTLQTEALRLRMVPVGPLFRRFERVLRDACRATGHEARLSISGERTELDKKLVDQLIDPLTHLIRNAVDHGLESPAERQQAGKPRRGTVRLEATHESGRVVIRVGDDGRGIDPARLRAAVAAKGLLPPEQAARLSEREAIAWIFSSGFSTADRVTDISGRGVGLDIVRSRISALSGSIEVESAIGAGTAFVIRLPLTLAMVRSLLVESGGARYALPLHAVREVVRIDESQVRRVAGARPHLEVRRELVPLVQLRAAADDDAAGAWAVLARVKDQAVAIRVDRVIREEELVVKPIPPLLRSANGATGAAVLGDGGIALFVDIAPLLARQAGAPAAGQPAAPAAGQPAAPTEASA